MIISPNSSWYRSRNLNIRTEGICTNKHPSKRITHLTPMRLWHTNGWPNLGQKTRSYNNHKKKKKRTCKIINFAIPADHRIKLKQNEKKKYIDLDREWKTLWNIKVTIIPIMIGSFGTVTKGFWKGMEDLELEGRVVTIQTTILLVTARIMTRVWVTKRDLLLLKPQCKPSAKTDVKNSDVVLEDFDIHKDHLMSARRPDPIIINKRKITYKIKDFAVKADHRIKLKVP